MDNKSKMHQAIDGSFSELVSSVQKFVRMDSVLEEDKITAEHPFGEKLTKVLDEFLKFAENKGFKTKNIANSAGYAEIGEGEKLIGILAHLDVVPVGSVDQWKHSPFSAVIENDKLYGRGSADDKGPAVASLYAIKALSECGIKLNCRYRLIVGLDEESGYSRCLNKYLETEETPSYSFSPDAYFPVINAEKGILRLDIKKGMSDNTNPDFVIEKITSGDRYNVVPDLATAYISGNKAEEELKRMLDNDSSLKTEDGKCVFTVKGVSAHAMEPFKGKNALHILLKKLASSTYAPESLKSAHQLAGNTSNGDSLGIKCSDEASGELTCNAAALTWGNGSYTIKFDVRYPVTADSAQIILNAEKAAKRAGTTLEVIQDKSPLHLPTDLPFIQTLLGAYNDITGDKGEPFSIGGGTYCRFLDNSVSFGPVFPHEEEMAHQPNEFISLDSLRKATHIYAEALYRINGM